VERPPFPAYLDEHFTRLEDEDYAALCVAENAGVADLWQERSSRPLDLALADFLYGPMRGFERDPALLAGCLERPSVVVTLPRAHAATFA
jgi:hypothetical protein